MDKQINITDDEILNGFRIMLLKEGSNNLSDIYILSH